MQANSCLLAQASHHLCPDEAKTSKPSAAYSHNRIVEYVPPDRISAQFKLLFYNGHRLTDQNLHWNNHGHTIMHQLLLDVTAKVQQIHGTTPDQGFAGTFVGPGYTEGNALTGDAKAFCNLLISTGIGSQVSPSNICNSTHTLMLIVHIAKLAVRWMLTCLAVWDSVLHVCHFASCKHSQQPRPNPFMSCMHLI